MAFSPRGGFRFSPGSEPSDRASPLLLPLLRQSSLEGAATGGFQFSPGVVEPQLLRPTSSTKVDEDKHEAHQIRQGSPDPDPHPHPDEMPPPPPSLLGLSLTPDPPPRLFMAAPLPKSPAGPAQDLTSPVSRMRQRPLLADLVAVPEDEELDLPSPAADLMEQPPPDLPSLSLSASASFTESVRQSRISGTIWSAVQKGNLEEVYYLEEVAPKALSVKSMFFCCVMPGGVSCNRFR